MLSSGWAFQSTKAKRYADWVKEGRLSLSVQCDTYDDVARATGGVHPDGREGRDVS